MYKKIITIFLFSMMSTTLFFSMVLVAETMQNYNIDFDDNLENWQEVSKIGESSISLKNLYLQQEKNNSVAKLTGTSRYQYNLTLYNNTKVTSSTFLNVSWMFENKESYYTGLLLTTIGECSVYIFSHFSGNFVNISKYTIIKFLEEDINVWYHHSLNLSSIYQNYFGFIPSKIDIIEIISFFDYLPSNQITYFDNISIYNEEKIVEFNFDNISGWQSYLPTEESNLEIYNYIFRESYYITAAKLEGTIRYRYNFAKLNLSVRPTSSTMLEVKWMFENKACYYIGIILITEGTCASYLYSHFHSSFINTSKNAICYYSNEQVSIWYTHRINLTNLYFQVFGFVPDTIDMIDIINMYDTTPSEQISYFHYINLENVIVDEVTETGDQDKTETGEQDKIKTIDTTLVISSFAILLLVIMIVRKRKRKRNQPPS